MKISGQGNSKPRAGLKPARIVAVLVTLLVFLPVVPASAAPTKMPVSQVHITRTATGAKITWQHVRAAVKYLVVYSTNPNLRHATIKRTKQTRLTVKLRTAQRYYVRVTALGKHGKTRQSPKRTIPLYTPKPVSAPTGPASRPTVQIAGTSATKLHVAWQGVTRGTGITITAGGTPNFTRATFTQPAAITANSADITVPAHLTALLGGGSGNPIYVKVTVANGPDTALQRTSGTAQTYLPVATTGGGAPLRVAQYNMQSVTASINQSNYPYAARRTALVNAVTYANPDILVAEELTLRNSGVGKTTQAADMANLLAEPGNGGYAWSTSTVQATPWAGGSSAGVNIFYKPQVATLIDSKVLPASALPVAYPTALTDQYWAYAKFRNTTSGTVFYVIGAHLAPGTDQATHDLRNRQLAAMDAYVSDLDPHAPIIFAGDFNGTPNDSDTPEAAVLVGRGYLDAAAAPTRSGAAYATENQDSRPTDHHGYPTTPYPYGGIAPRIDYILTKHMPAAEAYTNQVILRADGTFDPTYQGSDHNLQVATLRMP